MNDTQRSKYENLYPQNFNMTFSGIQMQLDVPEGVWNPTPHGIHLGHMILNIDFTGEKVLELGSGCGIHTILVARQGAQSLVVTEIADEILDNTRHNLKKHNCDLPVNYVCADWTHLPGQELCDTLITNPPFAKSGKKYRRYFIDTLINDAHKLIKPGGRLIFIQSSMAHFKRSEQLMSDWGMSFNIVGESTGPFRDYYYDDKEFMDEIERFEGAYHEVQGVKHETLRVYEARLPH